MKNNVEEVVVEVNEVDEKNKFNKKKEKAAIILGTLAIGIAAVGIKGAINMYKRTKEKDVVDKEYVEVNEEYLKELDKEYYETNVGELSKEEAEKYIARQYEDRGVYFEGVDIGAEELAEHLKEEYDEWLNNYEAWEDKQN